MNSIQLKAKNELESKISKKEYKFEKVNCLICNSSQFKKLAEKDRYGLSVSTVICKNCGLVQTNPRMNEESYIKFYDLEYRRLYVGEEQVPSHLFELKSQQGKNILKYLEKVTKQKITKKFVVDIGTGSGGVLYPFKMQKNEVLGLDYGSLYLNYGRKKGLNLKLGGVEVLENINKKIDVVIYRHVLEHLSNPIEELKKLRKFLHKDSIVYIEVPGLKNLHQSYNQDFLRYLQNAHLYHFTLKKIKEVGQISGFKLIHGDETIRSVFKIANNNDDYSNDLSKTIKYLKEVEIMRKEPINSYKLKNTTLNILKKAKLDKPIKKIYNYLLK